MPELTLKEAKKIYKSSEEAKSFLLTKFTKYELESKTNITLTQEEFNAFVKVHIFSLIDYSKTKYLDNNGYVSKTITSRIQLRTNGNHWLFDYNYNKNSQHFYYNYMRVYVIIKHLLYLRYSIVLTNCEIDNFMKSLVEKYFSLFNILPIVKSEAYGYR